MIRLQNSYYLLFLIPVFILIFYKFKRFENILKFNYRKIIRYKSIKRPFRYILRGIILTILILALCGPQFYKENEVIRGEGIDIMLLLDISTSMAGQDFKPDRLTAAKEVIKNFIDKRKNDRIGLVVFSGQSINRVPFTLDHDILKEFLEDVDFYMLPDGTAIGTAIANGMSRFKESDAKSKVMILLTDGANNAGSVVPETAAEAASRMNIKIYSIGVGTDGHTVARVKDASGRMRTVSIVSQLDEKLLKKISKITGGKYYRAKDTRSLEKIYEEISDLEKTDYEIQIYSTTREYFEYFIYAAFLLLFIDIFLFDILFKRLP